MNTKRIIMASGRLYEIPMFDPVVAKHFEATSSMADTLLEEINGREIYKKLFAGRKDLTFLDIGANIGLVSLYAYDSCQRIVAVEPALETFDVLKAMTFALPKIERVQAALAPEDGPCEFFCNNQNTTASSTVNTFGDMIEVPGLTLSSILSIYQLEHVDVAKVDCEGGEDSSLTFEQIKLATPIVDRWWIELHNVPRVNWESVADRFKHFFLEVGYHHVSLEGMRLEVFK